MTQALPDATGRTCLHAVYTATSHVCSIFVFSNYAGQNTQCCLHLHVSLFFCFIYYLYRDSLQFRPENVFFFIFTYLNRRKRKEV